VIFKKISGGIERMKWFMDMKIAAKLITGFIIVALIAMVVGVVGITNIKAIEKSDTELYTNLTVPISELGDISTQFQRVRVNARDMMLTNDPLLVKTASDSIAQRQADIAKDLESFNKTILSDRMRGLYDDLVKKNTTFDQQIAKVSDLTKQGKHAEAIALMSETGASGIASRGLQNQIVNITKAKLDDAKLKDDVNTNQANSAIIMMIIVMFAGALIAIGLGVFLSTIINKPIKRLAEAANKLAVGDVDVDVSVKRKTKDELGILMGSFEKMVENVRDQVNVIERIAAGDLAVIVKIKSDKDVLTKSLKQVVDTLHGLQTEMDDMSKQQNAGDIDAFISEEKFDGAYRVMAKGINDQKKNQDSEIMKVLTCIGEFGNGNFDAEIDKFPGKKVLINDNIEALRKNLREVSSEVNKLIIASQAGKLSERGNAQAFHGDWAELIKGLNGLLDNVVGPLHKAAIYIDRISKGNIPPKITESYNGDFNELKNSLNMCVDAIADLVADANMLAKAAVDGKLDTRADASKHGGDFGRIVDGVNKTLDTLVGHIDAMPSPVMLIDKDFNIVYMNKNGSELVSTTQKQLIGTKCYDSFKTSDCKTENCACAMSMQQGQKVSREAAAHPNGMNLDISYTAIPLKDGKNQVIGAMELVVDQTAIMNAARVSKKQAKYQEQETSKLLVEIENLAQGKLQCNSKIEPTDEDTNSIGEMFSNIYGSFGESLNAMSSYVKDTANVLTEMSKGNLDLSISGDYKGDFVEIKSSVNLIIDSLNEVLSDMNNASGQVAAGARQVSDSAQALSQGSTEQASALEELTASMEEISTETKHNATNATQANELALAAKEEATKGNDQMKGMLKAMDDINEGSGNIFKIIKVIDEIAFQTNILALNAAVEAARAGQHGKGFAVVAEEVRNLAARSANAAKETTDLIEGSIKKVEGGTKIANDTAVALSQIVEEVTKVTNLVGEIAIASNEQSLGINQVNQGILQVSDVVQTNSATSEESAAASEELSSQAELLREEVSRFKLKKSTGSSHGGFDDLNPEVLRMLEEMSNKKKGTNNPYSNQGYAEAAATSSKPKISLSDREFGKY